MRRLKEYFRALKKGFFDSPELDTLTTSLQRAHWKLNAIRDRQKNAEKTAYPLVDKGTQILLTLKYRELAERGVVLPLKEVGFKNYSQREEDGIIHYIFSLIGSTGRQSVEICAGIGSESISANLIINHDWHSLLVEGDEQNVRKGLDFFSKHPNTKDIAPTYVNDWVDRESVNTILVGEGFTGDVDLFVLDMDGVDYWIWDALTAISPRLVVVEVQPHLSDVSVTVSYDAKFEAQWIPLNEAAPVEGDAPAALSKRQALIGEWTMYGGASLPAFNKLAVSKGYRLIGANQIGHNAFFMRNDVGCEFFPEVSCESCDPHVGKSVVDLQRELLKAYAWEEI